MHHHQIVRQILLHAVQFLFDMLPEEIDLLAIAHVDGEGDGAAANPVAVAVFPGQKVQIGGRTLVAREMSTRSRKYTGLFDDDTPMMTLPIACASGNRPDGLMFRLVGPTSSVPAGSVMFCAPRTSFSFDGIVPVLRQPLLRVIQINLLRQDARPLDFRSLRNALQRCAASRSV